MNSHKAGKRLSAYKYLEWHPSSEYMDLLLSRAVGILEMPFGQYGALLALRRVLTTNELSQAQLKKIEDILHWAANLDYVCSDRGRHRLMMEIVLIISTNAGSGVVQYNNPGAAD
ncbi:MAG: hypothetical protein F6K19_48500 [Cyanothece sp. SIO1E1]|nr:hypothetical protein [Cyanothece sp. SIO1E1]